MAKALILGTNAGQADIIRYLIDAGWEVHACGHQPVGPGCALAHKFHLVDAFDVDAVRQLAVAIEADIVYSVSSDFGIRCATRVSEELGLPRLLDSQTVDLFHRKDSLRSFLHQSGVDVVQYKLVSSPEQADDWQSLPCVVKPVDSQGQRGVQLVRDRSALRGSVATAIGKSAGKSAIIEEYLDGVEISANVIVQGSALIVSEFTERLVHSHEHFGLPRGHSLPVRSLNDTSLEAARDLVERVVTTLGVSDAVLYVQLKVGEKGPRIIEIAPRLDGCHIWRLIKFARGYDLREYAINCLTRSPVRQPPRDSDVAKHTLVFHQMSTGSAFDPRLAPAPADSVFNEYRYRLGEKVLPINGSLEVVGYYIQRG